MRPKVVKQPKNQGVMVFLVLLTCALGAACFWLMFKDMSGTTASVEPDAAEPDAGGLEQVAEVVAPPPQRMEKPAEVVVSDPEPRPDPAPAIVEMVEDADTGSRFDDEEVLVLLGLHATHSTVLQRDADLLALAMEENAWADYLLLLERSLAHALDGATDALRRQGFDGLWQEQVFTQALLRWQVLDRMPLAAIRTDERDGSAMVAWMMTRNAPMQEWLLTIRPQDDLPRVVEILHDVWYGNQESFEKYFNLALACGVVFDREVRVQHPPQSAGYDARVTIDPLERFLWYVEKNESNRLAAPIHRMDARELVWVVCAPIATSEMEWAIDRMRLRRNRWGDAFGMVSYLMERAVSGVNPYEEYTFAEILKHGGICGDQSYFCANTARANGIPAMILSGMTDIGAHAWVALKPGPNEWTTLVGRIGGTSDGATRNPQTGERLTEQEVWLWNEREFRDSGTLAAIFRYHWLADLIARTTGEEELVENAVRQANRAGRNVPETWSRLADLLARKTRDAEDPGAQPIVDMWVRFSSDMKSQFRTIRAWPRWPPAWRMSLFSHTSIRTMHGACWPVSAADSSGAPTSKQTWWPPRSSARQTSSPSAARTTRSRKSPGSTAARCATTATASPASA